MFDIDYFKNVNDTYGHATGDYVIKSISGMVNEYLSEYNTHFGRWGGEEFVIIANEIDSDELQHICEELRIRISNYKFSNVNQITCSFGVIGVTPGETSLQAFERVDKAMYKAKSNGRNCVVCG
jgi:diguanylate cyclase (GGDEF)-like protein